MTRITLVFACAMLAVPAHAVSPVLAAPSSEPPDDQRIVCKQEVKAGSRFAKRTCKSKAQWDLIAEAHKRSAKELIDRPKVNTCKDSSDNCH